MGAGLVRDHITGVSKGPGNQANVPVSSQALAGSLLVLVVVFDNATDPGKPVVTSIDKGAGETNDWIFVGAARYPLAGTAGDFASAEMWMIKTTVAWPGGASYLVTWDASIVSKATHLIEFSGVEAVLRSVVGTTYNTSGVAASASTTGTTPEVGDLAVGLIFQSNFANAPAGDTGTTGGSWSVPSHVGTTGGQTATNNVGGLQYKILTAPVHQTLNNSVTPMTAGNGAIVAILRTIPTPRVTQAAYRFYADGTEAGAVALAAQNTAPVVDVSGDVNLGLRVRLQETFGLPLLSTDDWRLQWEKNASGTWNNVGTGGATVTSFASPNLTDGGATTNRLTGGSGSFMAGKVSEDGLLDNLGWAANNFTELLYTLTLKAVSFVDGDTLRFRVLKNDLTMDQTYAQTPTLTVTKGGKGSVVVGGAKKAVANRWVVVGGVKKPVVGTSVIVGGAKKQVR